jgi:PAS domain S-box-containing protein
MPVGVAILEGPEFRYFRINQVLADLNGLPVEEHLGRPLEEVLPKAAPGILPNLRKVIESGEAILAREFSIRLPSNHGKDVNLIDWHFPITVDGRIKAVGAIVMDITERKEAEERFHSVFEESPVAEVIVNEDGRITLVNGESEKTFGFDRDEMEGQPIEMLLPKRYRVNHPGQRTEFNAKPQSRKMGRGRDLFARHKNGREFPIEVALHPLKIDGKRMVLSVIVDISERKRTEKQLEMQSKQLEKANQELVEYHKNLEKLVEKRTSKLREEIIERKQVEAALRKSESSLSEAQRLAHLGHWEWNIPENKISWSDEVFRIFGFVPQQFEVTYDSFLDRIHPEDRSEVENAVNKVLADPTERFQVQHRIIGGDKTERIVEEQGKVNVDKDGKPFLMIGTVHDLTELKKVELETKRLRTELEHVNRVGTLDALASAIAHEINQPLAAILSNAQAAIRFLTNDQPDIKEVRETLIDIIKDDKRAGEIIRQIRGLVKKDELSNKPYKLNRIIKNVLKLINSEIVIHDINLTTDLDSGIRNLSGDSIQMQQVILNILMNAVEAIKEHTAEVHSIRISTKADGENGVFMSITDTGPGIREDIIEKIFDSFHTTKSEGMGLGLSLCQSIVETSGGSLRAENCPEGGANFTIWLPYEKKGDNS